MFIDRTVNFLRLRKSRMYMALLQSAMNIFLESYKHFAPPEQGG